jgi:hypothetical protein
MKNNTLNFVCLAFFLAASFVMAQQSKVQEPQVWVASDGRAIQANFVSQDGEFVTLIKEGKEFKIPFKSLAPSSINQAIQLSQKGLSLPPVNPTPPDGAVTGTLEVKEKGLKLAPGWDTDLQRGMIATSDFKHVLSLGNVRAAVDLSFHDKVELYRGIYYLDPAVKVREYLQTELNARPLSNRIPINAAGFPPRSISSYDYSGNFGGFGHFILVVDAADQVVGVQLLQNAPKSRLLTGHSNQWSVYNFLQSRKKGTQSYAIGYQVSSGAATFVVQSELVDRGGKSREWVKLILAKPFADIVMDVIDKSQ